MSDQRIHLFDDFTLDLTRGFLLRGDEPVHLRPQTYEVLSYLVEPKTHAFNITRESRFSKRASSL